jgi:hypothetical protein
VYYGEGSCSGVVKNIIKEKGLIAGWKDVKNQFAKCRKAALILANQKVDEPIPKEENKKQSNGDKSNWCFVAPAACAIPDPSDCTIASTVEGVSGACGGASEAVTGVCSCI